MDFHFKSAQGNSLYGNMIAENADAGTEFRHRQAFDIETLGGYWWATGAGHGDFSSSTGPFASMTFNSG